MKILHVLVATVAALASGDAQANNRELVIGGTDVIDGTRTYTVALERSDYLVCAGVLISPTHVLTTARCVRVSASTTVYIGSASLGRDIPETMIVVEDATMHPSYNPSTNNYDYAILELPAPSAFPPVKLYSADSSTFAGQNATVMGWGATAYDGVSSTELKRSEVPVITDAQCKAVLPITSSQLCTAYVGGKGPCSGDGGGPLVLERAAGDVLVGVVSLTLKCGTSANSPAVYSKVSFIKGWIQSLAPTSVWV